MPVKTSKNHNPEEMLMRLIRVAEILAKGQNAVPCSSNGDMKGTSKPVDVSSSSVQKTQSQCFDVDSNIS